MVAAIANFAVVLLALLVLRPLRAWQLRKTESIGQQHATA